MRIGIGYDIHKLVPERRLFLGGIQVPYHRGLEGYSDADVVLHAICDSLLGACGLGDIGEHFPNTDPYYKDISSKKLLSKVLNKVSKLGYKIGNLDIIILAQQPNIASYKKNIINSIANILKIDETCINIKAKTTEGLGDIGKTNAIASICVVLMEERKPQTVHRKPKET